MVCLIQEEISRKIGSDLEMKKVSQYVQTISLGFIACVSIAIVAQGIGRFFPQVGASLFAILLGMVAGNTFLNRQSLTTGVKFSESRLLEISIALTGLTLNLKEVLGVGVKGILFIVLQMLFTILVTLKLGQLFGFSRKFSLLMSAGNAVCGSSAVGTVSPIIEADETDKGISITIVNLTGTVLMVLLPLLTGFLYHQETLATSAMIGGVLQSVGQVIASAKLVSEDVTQYATIFKIIRIILLVVVAMSFAKINTKDGESFFKKTGNQKDSKKVGVPWFILVFFAGCITLSFVELPEIVGITAKSISNQLEIIALAGIGMRVKFKDLIKEGPKAMAYGGAIGVSQIVIAIVLIFLLIK